MSFPQIPVPSDPKQAAFQKAMMKFLSTRPETILALFDRLHISWSRETLAGEPSLVIKWFDLMKGENRNQEQGPFLKTLLEEMQANGELPGPTNPMQPVRPSQMETPASQSQPQSPPETYSQGNIEGETVAQLKAEPAPGESVAAGGVQHLPFNPDQTVWQNALACSQAGCVVCASKIEAVLNEGMG